MVEWLLAYGVTAFVAIKVKDAIMDGKLKQLFAKTTTVTTSYHKTNDKGQQVPMTQEEIEQLSKTHITDYAFDTKAQYREVEQNHRNFQNPTKDNEMEENERIIAYQIKENTQNQQTLEQIENYQYQVAKYTEALNDAYEKNFRVYKDTF